MIQKISRIFEFRPFLAAALFLNMVEELKIRIRNFKNVEKHIEAQGAKFLEEVRAIDSYYNQPRNRILKITEDERGKFLVELKPRNGKFEILRYEKIDEFKNLEKDLVHRYGIKRIIRKRRRFFLLGPYSVNINLIRGVGEFLIVEGNKVPKEVITRLLKIKSPEYVTQSFDEM